MEDQPSYIESDYSEAYKRGQNQQFQGKHRGVPFVVIPKDMKLEYHDRERVEAEQDRPSRLHQDVELLSADSFIEYVNRFSTKHTTIFVNPESGHFEAVLDYHQAPDKPAWKEHRASYLCPKSKEWNSWFNNNNERMGQEDFALFIEDNLKEIIEPNGAEMLEIAASLKAKNNVDFASSVRLDNGQVQFNYTETIDGQAGVKGDLSIPEKIQIAVCPFLNGPSYAVEARFRYRIQQGGLVMWYTLIRPHAVIKDAVDEVIERVETNLSQGQLIQAKAPR